MAKMDMVGVMVVTMVEIYRPAAAPVVMGTTMATATAP